MEEVFTCSICGETKPLSGYWKKPSKVIKCKDCRNAERSEKRKTDLEYREKINKARRDKKINDPEYREKVNAAHRLLYKTEKHQEYVRKRKEGLKQDEEYKERVREQRRRGRERNKEKIAAANKKWREENKEYVKYCMAKWYAEHKEHMAEYHKKLYQENKEVISKKAKKFREENRDKIAEARKKYRQTNHAKRVKCAWDKNKRRNDVGYHISCVLRSGFYDALSGRVKKSSAVRDLGCSIAELKERLEGLFYDNPRTGEKMNWDNYGKRDPNSEGWQIDHIIPVSSFDLTKRKEQLKVIHYTNLQPLWAIDNLRKNNRLDYEIQKQVA